MKLSKKGYELTQVPMVVVMLLVVSVVLGVGATILTNVQNTASMTSTATDTYENQSFTTSNTTAIDFTPSSLLTDGAGNTYIVANSCTGVTISNSTNGSITSLYTVSGCTAQLKAGQSNQTSAKAGFTFTHTVYLYGYNITGDGLTSQDGLSDWQATWIVIVAAAVVVGIVGRFLFFA